MTGAVGQNVTISGSGTLKLGGGTINGTAGLGILIDNANTSSLTINAAIQLAGAQTWMNNSGNLFTVGAGGVDIFNKALTINGTGNTTISGVVSNAGAFYESRLRHFDPCRIRPIAITGQLTVQAGTLKIDTINNAGSNGELGNNALSVILGSAGGNTGTLEYTGGSASSTKKFTMASGGTGAFQIDAAGATLNLSGVIDGSGGLGKTGSGTLVLSGANTYTGTTTIGEGSLSASNIVVGGGNSSLGNATSAVALGGASTSGSLVYTGRSRVTHITRGFTGERGWRRSQQCGHGIADDRHGRNCGWRQPHLCDECQWNHGEQRHQQCGECDDEQQRCGRPDFGGRKCLQWGHSPNRRHRSAIGFRHVGRDQWNAHRQRRHAQLERNESRRGQSDGLRRRHP